MKVRVNLNLTLETQRQLKRAVEHTGIPAGEIVDALVKTGIADWYAKAAEREAAKGSKPKK